MITVEELSEMCYDKKLKFYKDAWARGYVSRKTDGYIESYSGKYGKGYVWHRPTDKSTKYHIIEYYLFPTALKGRKH